MRAFLLSIALSTTLVAHAQQPAQPPAGSNWQHVQALPVGTKIYVNANDQTATCKLISVDDGTLTCTHGKATTFQRSEIKSVKIPRHAVSTAILAGAGAGVGVGVVAATSNSIGFGGWAKGSVYAGGAGVGAVLFGSIGYFTDFARSTIYKAP